MIDSVLPHEIGSSPQNLLIVSEAHNNCRTPPQQPVVEWQHVAKYVITGQIMQAPEKNTESDSVIKLTKKGREVSAA